MSAPPGDARGGRGGEPPGRPAHPGGLSAQPREEAPGCGGQHPVVRCTGGASHSKQNKKPLR